MTRAFVHPARLAITAGAALCIALTTCRGATQIVVTVVTDVACTDRPSTLVTVGDLHEIETKPGVASSERCDVASSPTRVGTLVITPSGSHDEGVAFKVVEAIGGSPEACIAPDYKGCIVARRALRFIPNETLAINVSMLLSCTDVPCGETQTCVRGNCKSAVCDGASGGCDDPALRDAPDAGDDASLSNGCKGSSGPAMVRFDVPSPAYSFCIDTTEVTHEQFNAFLANPGTPIRPPECQGQTDLPSVVVDPLVQHRPRSVLSFCDAWAYCAWAGKRLCGTIGGGRATNDGSVSNEWVYACSNGTASPYPYGAAYDPSACNTEGDAGAGSASFVDVASKPRCHGVGSGFVQIFDMSGNAAELDSYAGSRPLDDAGTIEVEARGGAVSEGVRSTCSDHGELGQYTRSASDVIGFRCCSDVTP